MTTCTTLRFAVLLSLGLLVGGFVLLGIIEATGFSAPTAHVALALALTAVAVLFVALLIAVWPGSNRRLSQCQH